MKLQRIATQRGIEPTPPPALILGGWNLSYDQEKAQQWRDTLEWAQEHGLERDVVLAEADFHRRFGSGAEAWGDELRGGQPNEIP
jgi:hypothetical protein